MKANLTVNFVPFGEDITELWMLEICDFVAPVNILTLFACTPYFLRPHNTLPCVLICTKLYICVLLLKIYLCEINMMVTVTIIDLTILNMARFIVAYPYISKLIYVSRLIYLDRKTFTYLNFRNCLCLMLFFMFY